MTSILWILAPFIISIPIGVWMWRNPLPVDFWERSSRCPHCGRRQGS